MTQCDGAAGGRGRRLDNFQRRRQKGSFVRIGTRGRLGKAMTFLTDFMDTRLIRIKAGVTPARAN